MSAWVDLVETRTRLWVTADHHFGHANIVAYAGRPFPADRQDQEMAKRWRETVPEDEPLLHLGDLVVGSNPAVWDLVPTLPGKPKWLVLGNHDRPHRHALIEAAGFIIVDPVEIQHRGWLVRMTHRPIPAAGLGLHELNVHGHTHSRLAAADARWINVSVEATEYRPIRLLDLVDARLRQLSSVEVSLGG